MTQLTHSSSPPPLSPQPLPLRVISHNIRYAAAPPSLLPQERPWPQRLPGLLAELNFLTRATDARGRNGTGASVVCLQEVLTSQVHGIAGGLNGPSANFSSKEGDGGASRKMEREGEGDKEWTWRGVGRDDGKDEGERCVILFRGGGWEEVHFETVWLNEDGKVGRRGWDAGSVRVVSCLVLDSVTWTMGDEEEQKEKVENEGARKRRGRRVLVMNTHLDNAGRVAREKSTGILLRVARRLSVLWDVDFWVVAGDLNSEEDGEAYRILQHSGMGKEEVRVRDAMKCIPDEQRERRYGEYYTYTGFDGKGDEDEKLQRIDFVFVGGKEELEGRGLENSVEGYAVMPNGWEDGGQGRVSDHRAVCVDLLI